MILSVSIVKLCASILLISANSRCKLSYISIIQIFNLIKVFITGVFTQFLSCFIATPFFLTLFFLMFCSSNLFASPHVSRLSPDNGLSQGVVYSMKLDDKGQLWLATESDLDRYDGTSIEHLRSELRISNDIVWDFDFVTSSRLHVATADSGLLEVDLSSGALRYLQRETDPSFSRNSAITLIRQDKEQNRWYASALSIYRMSADNRLTEVFRFSGKDPQEHHIRDLLRIDDRLIIATSMGLFQYNLSTKTLQEIYYLPNTASADQLNSKTLLLHEQSLLIGTVSGLYRLPLHELNSQSTATVAENLLPNHNVWKIKLSQQADLLAGTNVGFLQIKLATGSVETLFQPGQTDYAYADDTILDFIELGDSCYWLASRGDGAYFLDLSAKGFNNIYNRTGENRLSHNFVFGLYSTEKELWIGTQNGLNLYQWQSGKIEQITATSGNSVVDQDSTIYGIYPDKTKRYLWLLTGVSLTKFDTVEKKIIETGLKADEKFFKQYFYSITQNKKSELLTFNTQGAFRIDADSNVEKLQSLSAFLKSPQDAQWFGVNPVNKDEILFFYQNAIWLYAEDLDSVSLVYKVPEHYKNQVMFGEGMQQLDQSLWFLISGLGLVELDAKSLADKSHFFSAESPELTTTILYGLQRDNQGYLWMSSHSGLWRFNPTKKLVRQFTHRNGLAYNEFNSGSSLFNIRQNKLVYGSLRGIAIFNPSEFVSRQQVQSQLFITKTTLESKITNPKFTPITSEQIDLAHDDFGLKIQVAAFDYKSDSDIIYHFDLNGPVDLPDYVKTLPQLALPNLQPGEYSLQITAFNTAAEQYSKPAVLNISVAYPPWRSPLAYVSYTAILLAFMSIWIRYRAKQRAQLLVQHNALKQLNNKLELSMSIASSDVWEADLLEDNLSHSNRMPMVFIEHGLNYSLVDYLNKIHPEDRAGFVQNWQALKTSESDEFNCTYRIKSKDGDWLWFKDVGKLAVVNADKSAKVYGLYTDITVQKLTEYELEQLSHYDQITGLPNRNLLQQYLIQVDGSFKFSAFVVIKLLQFSEVKSAFGDLAANSALLQVSSRLRSHISTPDLLIHAAESTFIVALCHSDIKKLATLSERLLAVTSDPLIVQEQNITIPCIAGTASQTKMQESPQQLLNQAELALRAAKEGAIHQHLYYQSGLLEQTRNKFILQQQLREAVRHRHLLNYYQPIINAKTDKLVGVELLSRWQLDGKFVSPDVFIPAAERIGIIDDIAFQSLSTACDDLQTLHSSGQFPYISINLTGTQLCSSSVLNKFKEIVKQKSISPADIRLEITESTLIHNQESAIHNMNELRSAGFQIFLDDFGTGYSSLKYIQDFPLSAIKIDRSFVANISNSTAIIDTIITLAESLDVICIAEGVETSTERDYLLSKGCCYMQGYFYSKPLEIRQLMAKYSQDKTIPDTA